MDLHARLRALIDAQAGGQVVLPAEEFEQIRAERRLEFFQRDPPAEGLYLLRSNSPLFYLGETVAIEIKVDRELHRCLCAMVSGTGYSGLSAWPFWFEELKQAQWAGPIE